MFDEVDLQLSDDWRAKFSGYTLWLQGNKPSKQPVVDEFGNILLWNGDIFEGLHNAGGQSDTAVLLETLQEASTVEDINSVMEKIKGPWACIYYKSSLNLIIVGRDKLGRHSLLWNLNDSMACNNVLVLSSTVINNSQTFREIPARSMFTINFSSAESVSVEPIFDRNTYLINSILPNESDLINWDEELVKNKSYSQLLEHFESGFKNELDRFEAVLSQAVRLRINCQPEMCKSCVRQHLTASGEVPRPNCAHPKLAILFSGGLDSTVLAALADRIWPMDEEIDLLNVAFQPMQSGKSEPFAVPDRLTGLQALHELRTISPSRKWNFVKVVSFT